MPEKTKLILLIIFSISFGIFCLVQAYKKAKKYQKLTESERKIELDKDEERHGIVYLIQGILETIKMLFK